MRRRMVLDILSFDHSGRGLSIVDPPLYPILFPLSRGALDPTWLWSSEGDPPGTDLLEC